MENTRALKVVRESRGSLLLTLTGELKLIGAIAGQKVAVSADPRGIQIAKAEA
ncbi:MAG: hypothetical protein JRN66_07070 [Nitrososphaerota archaeon]|nr:hypothetical protein [Nitrososphaerota archaeon]